jgi:hypothetical protein
VSALVPPKLKVYQRADRSTWVWMCPGDTGGGQLLWSAALAAALAHRKSVLCKYRRYAP